MAARARAAGYGDRLSRTEVASLSDEFDKKPEHQLAYNNERIRTLDDLIKNHAIPPDKQELLKSTPDGLATLAKNDSEVAALTQSMADLKKYGTDREMKIEAAKNAEKTATAHETTAVAAKITAERKEVQVPKTLTEAIMSGASKEQIRQIIDAEVEIKKKTPGADPYALADYRAALKEKADELKATAKEAATNKAAWTKHSEAEAAGIAKAGSLTNVPQGTIDAWNTVRRNLGKGEYDYELASSFNPFSTYSKITAPKDAPAAIAPVQVWTKDKTGKPVPVRN
jgi:pantothenate kinase type III